MMEICKHQSVSQAGVCDDCSEVITQLTQDDDFEAYDPHAEKLLNSKFDSDLIMYEFDSDLVNYIRRAIPRNGQIVRNPARARIIFAYARSYYIGLNQPEKIKEVKLKMRLRPVDISVGTSIASRLRGSINKRSAHNQYNGPTPTTVVVPPSAMVQSICLAAGICQDDINKITILAEELEMKMPSIHDDNPDSVVYGLIKYYKSFNPTMKENLGKKVSRLVADKFYKIIEHALGYINLDWMTPASHKIDENVESN
jgi:hypothetical protein